MGTKSPGKKSRSPHNEKVLFSVLLLIVLAVTYLSFSPSLDNGFVNWDDHAYVVDNPLIKDLSYEGIKKIFKLQSIIVGNYHPLTMVSFALEYHFFYLEPRAYHLNNILLHLISTFLVYIFVCSLTGSRKAAILTALLFGIHPLRVESVAWVSERKDALFMPFYLSSLICYIKYIKTKKSPDKYYGYASFWFLLSVFSKPTGISLPIVLLLLDHYFDRDIKKNLKEKIPLFVCSFVLGVVALYGTYTDLDLASGIEYSYNYFDRIFMVCFAILAYLIKVIIPIPMSALYPNPEKVNGLLPGLYYFSGGIMCLIIYFVRKAKKISKAVQFAALFFLVTIFLNLPILNVGYTVIADRFTYLPYLGIFLVLALEYEKIVHSTKKLSDNLKFGLKLVVICFVCWFISLTVYRCQIWKSSETLWNDVIKTFPDAAMAYHNRGLHYYGQSQYKKALDDFNAALKIKPNYATAYFNLGNIAAKHNDPAGAIKLYTKTLEINPRYYYAYNNRGGMYQILGKDKQALDDYTQALKIKQYYVDAYVNRGQYFFAKGQWDEALSDIEKALKYNPDSIPARNLKRQILEKRSKQ